MKRCGKQHSQHKFRRLEILDTTKSIATTSSHRTSIVRVSMMSGSMYSMGVRNVTIQV
jgi:hypothetical protein